MDSDLSMNEEDDKQQEEQKVQAALQLCGYPQWTFKKVKYQMSKSKTKKVTKQKAEQSRSKGMVVLPYGTRKSQKKYLGLWNNTSSPPPWNHTLPFALYWFIPRTKEIPFTPRMPFMKSLAWTVTWATLEKPEGNSTLDWKNTNLRWKSEL